MTRIDVKIEVISVFIGGTDFMSYSLFFIWNPLGNPSTCHLAVVEMYQICRYIIIITQIAFCWDDRACHYSDITWALVHFNSLSNSQFFQQHVQANIKEHSKAGHYWHLMWREWCSHWWIPYTKGQLCGKHFHVMISSWYHWFSSKLWYLQHICVGDTIVYH